MVQNNQELRRKNWVTHSSFRLFIYSHSSFIRLLRIACLACLLICSFPSLSENESLGFLAVLNHSALYGVRKKRRKKRPQHKVIADTWEVSGPESSTGPLARPFALTSHSFACSTLLVSLARSTALTCSLAHSLPLWDSDWLGGHLSVLLSILAHSATEWGRKYGAMNGNAVTRERRRKKKQSSGSETKWYRCMAENNTDIWKKITPIWGKQKEKSLHNGIWETDEQKERRKWETEKLQRVLVIQNTRQTDGRTQPLTQTSANE